MRRFLTLFSLFLFHTSVFAIGFGGVNINTDEVKNNLKENSTFISTGDNIKKLELRQMELISSLKLGKDNTSEISHQKQTLIQLIQDTDNLLKEWSTMSIRKIQLSTGSELVSNEVTELESLNSDIAKNQQEIAKNILELSKILDFGPFSLDTPFPDLQKEFPTMKRLAENTVRGYDIAIADAEKNKNSITLQNKKELDELTAEIARLKQVRRDQILQSMKQVLVYVAIFFGIYLTKVVSGKMVRRFGSRLSKSHKEAVILFHRWIFHTLFAGAFLIIFASELIAFLPFVAILGTAVGLALRDVIYSFIGWFAVGSSSGYQEGDFIEFEGTQGRAYRITPLLTTIEEYGPQGFTGKIVSFPNKTIFEKNVKNWSRGSDFSLMTIDFLLTHQSNIEKAKQLLLDLTRENKKLYDDSHAELNSFKNTYKYGDEDLEPQIHVVSDPRGIILRVRVLVHVQDKLREESRIMEEFSAIIQKQKDIAFRTV